MTMIYVENITAHNYEIGASSQKYCSPVKYEKTPFVNTNQLQFYNISMRKEKNVLATIQQKQSFEN